MVGPFRLMCEADNELMGSLTYASELEQYVVV
jgi:hypothetical protein